MIINKSAVFAALFMQLDKTIKAAKLAAENARQLATHEQSKPETQYDTVGLEASYLAHGQSQRAADLYTALEDWKSLENKHFDEDSSIAAGALVELVDSDGHKTIYLVGNHSGGMKIETTINDQNERIKIIVISLLSPIGKALHEKQLGDEFPHPVKKDLFLEVVSLI